MIEFHNFESQPISVTEITQLFQSSFNIKMDEAYWKWRFENNPVSKDITIVYATDEGKLVAYYAVSPVNMINSNGEKVKMALSNMTMTHPDYQGRGLFKSLATQLFDGLKTKGYVGVFGFANSNSHYGFRKNLGWKDIAALNVFTLSRGTFRDFLIKKPLDLNFEINDTSAFDLSGLKKLSRIETGCFHSEILANEYNWRFNSIPTNNYKYIEAKLNNQVVGHVVFKQYGDDLDLMEYWFGDQSEVSKNDLLPYLIQYLVQNYSGDINFWSNLHSSEHLVLEKFGFQEKGFNSYFGAIPFTDNADFLELEKWHYRFTESDIF